MVDDFRREQRGRRLKGTVLGPVARAALAWAPGRAPLGLRAFLIRRATLPYFRARDERFERPVDGATFVGSTTDMLNLYVFVFGVWEPYVSDFLTSRLDTGDVFVDVGANAGWYTVLAAPKVGDEGSVIAVEPSAPIAERLELQVSTNGFGNVRILREAVSDHVGRVTVEPG